MASFPVSTDEIEEEIQPSHPFHSPRSSAEILRTSSANTIIERTSSDGIFPKRVDSGNLPEGLFAESECWLSFFESEYIKSTRLGAARIDTTMRAIRLERRNRERVNCNPGEGRCLPA